MIMLPTPALSGSGLAGRGFERPPLSLAIQAPRKFCLLLY